MAIGKGNYDEILTGFNSLVSNLETRFASDVQYTDILDWFDNGGIDKESLGMDLQDEQRVILATFFGLKLTEKQQSILEFWKAKDKTTYDFDYRPTPRQNLVLEVGRRGSKCQNLNSLVQTRLGLKYLYELIPMPSLNSFVNTEKGLFNLEEITSKLEGIKDSYLPLKIEVAIEGIAKTSKTENFYIKGKSQTKKITTACGYNIDATPEHRIKVMDRDGTIVWRYLKDIQIGEYVCIHRSTQLFPNNKVDCSTYVNQEKSRFNKVDTLPKELTSSWSYFLGLLVANGSWTNSKAIELHFHVQDTTNYEEAFHKIGIVNPTLLIDSRSPNGVGLRYGSLDLREFFTWLGFAPDSKVNTKKTPWSIRESPKEVQAAYLSGLFDGDGMVVKGGREISLSSASKALAQETQLILLNFGIVTNVFTTYVNETLYYIIKIRGQRSVRTFLTEIGFRLARKQDFALASIEKASRDGGDTERIPYQIEWLKRIRKSLPDNTGCQPGSLKGLGLEVIGQKTRNLRCEYARLTGNTMKPSSGELLSSYRLDKIIEFGEEFATDLDAVDHFTYIRDCNYFYDPVVSIEDTEALCVDLSVPGYEQYVCQGMTNHNTLMGALVGIYIFETLSRLESPQKHYNVAANTLISIICIATSGDQAGKTIYGQMSALIYHAPFLRRLIDKGDIEVLDKMIRYKEKLLYIYSGNSRGDSQVGGAPILLILDEGAFFEDKDGQSNALNLWDNLGAGGLIFREDAKRMILSSAAYYGDALEVLYKAAAQSQAWLGFRLESWDVNPLHASRDNPVIAAAYISNPKMAQLLYQGIRSSAINSFFSYEEVIACFNIMTSLYVVNRTEGGNLVKLQITELAPYVGKTYLHLDPAIIGDSYGLAFGHGELLEGLLHVYIDGIMAWQPQPGVHVSVVNVQEAIEYIHSRRPLTKVSADHKESSETLQRLAALGLDVEMITFSNPKQLSIYEVCRSLVNEGRLHLPKNSPWTPLLKDEFYNLESIKDIKVDHRAGSSKDVLDCVATVCWHIAGQDYSTGHSSSLILSSKERRKNKSSSGLLVYSNEIDPTERYLLEIRKNKKKWEGLKSASRILSDF